MEWHPIHDVVRKHIVRIETQEGTGTGFLFGHNKGRVLAAVATAAHVISHAHQWQQPIRLVHHASQQELFLPSNERVVFIDHRRDSASILVPASSLPFEPTPLGLIDPAQFIRVGVEVAWMGFPSVAYPELCFFRGCVSAFIHADDCYLVDGVAINGVSGGPVFAGPDVASLQLIGTVSAYLPNRAGGTPGLLRAQDISAFHNDLQTIYSFDEAKEKEREAQQKAIVEGQGAADVTARPEGETPSES